MKVALGVREVSEENLKFAKQLGVNHIVVHTPELAGDGYWEELSLWRLKALVESAGLELAAIENLPRNHYDKLLLGAPGREEQVEKVCETIKNMGRVGIPILGYNWMLLGVWRTPPGRGRGDAQVTSFDYDQVKDAPLSAMGRVDEEEIWENYTYFLKQVIPVAEEAGVKLGLHPDDPPVPLLSGTARIFRSVEALKRAIEIITSDYNGLEFCQGTIAEMGADIVETIRYFGKRKKIFYVHFRNVKGIVPRFDESFIDDGDVDMLKAMQAYKEVGFDGPIIPDHTPKVVGDTLWGHRGWAFAVGYIKALIKAVDSLP